MYGQRQYHFSVSIPREEMLRYYQGTAQHLLVRTTEGLTQDLSAHHLRPFVTAQGIHGSFVLTVSSDNKFISLKQI